MMSFWISVADLAIQRFGHRAGAHALAAVQLHGAVDHRLGLLGGNHLGHGGFAGDAGCAGIALPGGAVDQQGGAIDVGRHLCERRLRPACPFFRSAPCPSLDG